MEYYTTYADYDLYNCPLCDGVNEAATCPECEETHCSICLEAYGCDGCE